MKISWYVHMHASSVYVSVLTRKGHVICYESMKLKENEQKYYTHDLELATIVHALKIWRHNLMGMKFELRIDFHVLKYLFEK